jgi:hypothetical protein
MLRLVFGADIHYQMRRESGCPRKVRWTGGERRLSRLALPWPQDRQVSFIGAGRGRMGRRQCRFAVLPNELIHYVLNCVLARGLSVEVAKPGALYRLCSLRRFSVVAARVAVMAVVGIEESADGFAGLYKHQGMLDRALACPSTWPPSRNWRCSARSPGRRSNSGPSSSRAGSLRGDPRPEASPRRCSTRVPPATAGANFVAAEFHGCPHVRRCGLYAFWP